jgi:hypothetical protein
MAQNVSPQPARRPPEPFSAGQSPADRTSLFWSRLHTYRPLFLLGGLWFTLVCVSAIAYRGLMFNEPVQTAPPPEALLTTPAPLPTVLESLPEVTPADLASLPEVTPADLESPTAVITTEESAAQFSLVTLWGLLSLVGLCAFGCFVITQQIKASARPAKPKKVRPRPLVKAPTAQSPQRLSPYSPQRDGMIAPGVRVLETPAMPRPATPPSDPPNRPQARPMPRPQPTVQALPAAPVSAAAESHIPAVVVDTADLPLDWAEGSVAHALDMRQRRSLSSFM